MQCRVCGGCRWASPLVRTLRRAEGSSRSLLAVWVRRLARCKASGVPRVPLFALCLPLVASLFVAGVPPVCSGVAIRIGYLCRACGDVTVVKLVDEGRVEGGQPRVRSCSTNMFYTALPAWSLGSEKTIA